MSFNHRILSKGGSLKLVDLLCLSIVGIVLARHLGPHEYGIYSTVIAVAYLVGSLILFGLPTFLLREVSAYHEQNKIQEIFATWSGALKLYLPLSVFGIATVLVILSYGFSDLTIAVVLLGSAIVPCQSFPQIVSSFIRGYGFQVRGLVPILLVRPLSFLMLTICVIPYFKGTASLALTLLVGSFALSIVSSIIQFYRFVPKAPDLKIGRIIDVKKLFPIALVAGLQLIFHKIDILTASIFLTSSEVGIFRAANQLAQVIAIPLMIVRLLIGPNLSRLYSQNDFRGLRKSYVTGQTFAILAAVPIAVIIILFRYELFSALFGEEYLSEGLDVVLILGISQIVIAVFGPVGQLLMMTNNENTILSWIWKGIVLNVTLNLILLSIGYGIEGIAIASLISTIMMLTAFRLSVKKLFRF